MQANEEQDLRFEIEFGHSTSQFYDEAIDLAQSHPSFEEEGEGKHVKRRVELDIEDIQIAEELWGLVSRWKSSTLWINGEEILRSGIKEGGIWCFLRRQEAEDPDQYCFGTSEGERNIWSCKTLRMPVTLWSGGWLANGRFDNRGVWHVDKGAIRKELDDASENCRFCPVFDRQKVYTTLDSFPDKINPKDDPNWEYCTRSEYDEKADTYRKIAVGITPVMESMHNYVLGSFKPTFVDPEPSRFVISEEKGYASSFTIQAGNSGQTSKGGARKEQSKKKPKQQDQASAFGILIFIVMVIMLFAWMCS